MGLASVIGRAQSLALNTKRSEVVNLHASLKGVLQTGAIWAGAILKTGN